MEVFRSLMTRLGLTVNERKSRLTQVAEIIRTIERQDYVAAIFSRHIDPSDWPLRCEIVEVLLERYRLLLLPELLECATWQLVDDIPAMVLRILSSCPPIVKL
jgi:hypothetical protein